MKSIIVSGGLGNQMFLYALYLAMKMKGIKVRMDISLYNFVKIHNGYELDRIFNCPAKLVNRKGLHIFCLRVLLRLKPKFLLLVDNGKLNLRVFNTQCGYLAGYWQSEKYFKNYITQVKHAFTFKNIDAKNERIAQEMQNCNSVSLHIRRGDYVGMKEYEGICAEDYYIKAINFIKKEIENPFFYIFSNDMEWSQQFIENMSLSCTFITHNIGINSYKDMYLMSKCRYNIVANSSFSWWGAWLNSYERKTVIAPKVWFNSSDNKYEDIVPKEWIRI